ncbi:MAG: hypothetical protein PHH11_15505 [Methylomonas sp.]|nr:hypothetical protein [Methylomonas sp.]
MKADAATPRISYGFRGFLTVYDIGSEKVNNQFIGCGGFTF